MNQILHKFINTLSEVLYKQHTQLKTTLPRLWYGTHNSMQTTSEEELRNILKKRFPEAKVIQVEDVSSGCGAMFNIYVETKEFKGLSIAKQHKSIYNALDEQIKRIHGVHIITKAIS